MWILQLNSMTGRTEDIRPVACADTREQLEGFVAKERVEPYGDPGDSPFGGTTTWHKVFRKGGPLEWFNPPETTYGCDAFVDIGTEYDAASRAQARFREFIESLFRVAA